MMIWAIPGAGKSHYASTNRDTVVDWDEWQFLYRKKHPNLQSKIGFKRFLETCLESCRKHNPKKIILTSKLLHLPIADVVVISWSLDRFLRTTNRPGREEWSKEKCQERLAQYKGLIRTDKVILLEEDQYFSDIVIF